MQSHTHSQYQINSRNVACTKDSSVGKLASKIAAILSSEEKFLAAKLGEKIPELYARLPQNGSGHN